MLKESNILNLILMTLIQRTEKKKKKAYKTFSEKLLSWPGALSPQSHQFVTTNTEKKSKLYSPSPGTDMK